VLAVNEHWESLMNEDRWTLQLSKLGMPSKRICYSRWVQSIWMLLYWACLNLSIALK